MPSSDMASVRGIGVAVSVSTSTSARRRLSCSFWRTPKRCSSSMMTRPRFLNLMSGWISLWVPMTRSIVPAAMPSSEAFTSFAERKRDSSASFTGRSENRSEKTLKCCSASSVVGTSTATCLPSAMATYAARSATSVLPKPTSPQTSRSIGWPDVRSLITASIAACWSAVSSNGKPSAKAS